MVNPIGSILVEGLGLPVIIVIFQYAKRISQSNSSVRFFRSWFILCISGIGLLGISGLGHFESWLTFPIAFGVIAWKWRDLNAGLSGMLALAWIHESIWYYLGALPAYYFLHVQIPWQAWQQFLVVQPITLTAIFLYLFRPSGFLIPIISAIAYNAIWLLSGFPVNLVNQYSLIPPLEAKDIFEIGFSIVIGFAFTLQRPSQNINTESSWICKR